MALTVPTIPVGITQCTVTVGATDMGISIPLVLTQDQMSTWSDDDLTNKVTAFKTALEAFVPVGLAVQVQVQWMTQGFATTVNTSEQVK